MSNQLKRQNIVFVLLDHAGRKTTLEYKMPASNKILLYYCVSNNRCSLADRNGMFVEIFKCVRHLSRNKALLTLFKTIKKNQIFFLEKKQNNTIEQQPNKSHRLTANERLPRVLYTLLCSFNQFNKQFERQKAKPF